MAAGKGVRMLPLTKDIPKPLIRVNGKPFLYYLMKNLIKAGFEDIGIIVGYKKEKIKEFLGEFGFRAELIEQKEQLGTGHAVKVVKDFIQNNFIVVNGDNLYSAEDLKKINIEDAFNYVSGFPVDNPDKFGVLLQKDGFLQSIAEKPKEFKGNMINTGLYKFTPEIFSVLKTLKKSERGEYELTEAITCLAEENKVKVFNLSDYWIDFGCPEDLPKLETFLRGVEQCAE